MSTFALNLIKFEDIRSEIVNFLKENSEFSSQFDFTGSNISLIVDTMAYITMMMSYQVSNTANNMFLDSTTIRKNAVSIAKTMGYRPQRPVASRIYGTIEYYDPSVSFTADDALTSHVGDKITIPAYTPFVSDSGFQYTNLNDIILTVDPYDEHLLKAQVLLYEGTLKKYSYLGNNTQFQTFTIPSKQISEEFFDLKVRKNNEINGVIWSEVKQSFNLLSKNSYFLEEDLNTEGHVKVVFGDGIISNYPTNTEIVDVYYLETSADVANFSKLITLNDTTLTSNFVSYDVTKFRDITTTTGNSFGGTPLETLSIIKDKAPKSFANAGRAVTQYDYKNILANNASVYKSTSIGGDILYQNDPTKLGNIYLSAIPYITDIQNNFWDTSNVYVDSSIEAGIYNSFERYKIISTQLNFLKPSYVGVKITPYIELKNNISQVEIESIKTNIKNSLQTFYNDNFNDFQPTFRSSRINGIISETQGVVSSYFTADYSFAISKNSFYELYNVNNNVIFLPVVIKKSDEFGNVEEYDNFIKTNVEEKEIQGLTAIDVLPIEKRTIYGKIKTSTNTPRYLYNEDVINPETPDYIEHCNIKIYGKNDFVSVYRIDSDLSLNVITINENFKDILTCLPVSSDIALDNYSLTYDNVLLGNVKRTSNSLAGFKGILEKESDMTITPSNGDFYKAIANFTVSGTNNTFVSSLIKKDDVVMFNSSISGGGKWEAFTKKGDISAVDDTGLFSITDNSIYPIINSGVSGDFDGILDSPVTSGDYIIFDLNSQTQHKWKKLNGRYDLTYNFDPTTDLVKEVVNYEIKKVIGLGNATTNFNGRTNLILNDNDLIYYNPASGGEWVLICNTVSGIPSPTIITANPVSGGSLEIYSYSGSGEPVIGTALVVNGIGDLGTSKSRVNWISEEIAYTDDILIYVGDGRWNIWQASQPEIFNIDGTIISQLPIAVSYGDVFLVHTNLGSSGTFNVVTDPITYIESDRIIYTGSNTWLKFVTSTNFLNPTTSAGLPEEAKFGDIFRIIEDGSFNDSYLIYPQGQEFVQGDYIIFNGTHYIHVNEYTFEYEPIGRSYINNLELNSVFQYEFSINTREYVFYFNDIFNGSTIGTFRYKGVQSSSASLFDVGKIIFEKNITGSNDLNSSTDNISLRFIFDELTTNSIRILPKNKVDINGLITSEQLNNFDTNFNTFLIANTNEVVII